MEYLNRRKFLGKAGLYSSGLAMGAPAISKGFKFDNSFHEQSPQTLKSISSKLSGLKASHPSLHFNAQTLKELRKKAKGTHQHYAKRLYQWVETNKGWNPPELTGEQGEEVQLEESGAFLTNASLAFCLSRKEEHFEIARKWVLTMCDYPEEVIRNYGIGIYAAGLARSFDWLYHDYANDDRERIKACVNDIVSQMYENAQPGAKNPSWWTDAYIHHDFFIPMGGLGEAALALIGEVEDANNYAAFARANFDTALSWMGDDGAWHEGVADWCYAMAPLLWFYGAWQSVTGENLHNHPWIKNTASYRLYHWLPNHQYVNLNDSFRSGRYSTSGSASCHLLRRLASLFKDGHAQWLAGEDEVFDFKPSPKGVYQAPYEKLSYLPEPQEYPHPDSQTAAWNMLWYDPEIESVPPTQLPGACHFSNMDIVMMRTGWTKDDAVISFSCAPLAGQLLADRLRKGDKISRGSFYHDHADYNSFTLFARGQYFIIPAGYARRASHFQNVVSVNGADFNADPSLKIQIEVFRNDNNFSYAVGDATEGFLPGLGVQSYRRHILLFDNSWLIIFDDLKLDSEGQKNQIFNRFSWTIHSDPNTHNFSIYGNKVELKSNGNNSALSIYIIEPTEFGWERELFQSVTNKPMMEALRLTKPEWYNNNKQVLSVMSWNKESGEPIRINHREFIAVLLANDKAIGFAHKPGIPSDFSNTGLKGREMLLFGTDPNKPDTVIRVKDGRVI